MAYIKINPEGMLTVINNLDERASAVDTERRNIDNSSSANHDPVASVVSATDVLSGSGDEANVNAWAEKIWTLAEELRTRRQEAIDMNSSGITSADSNGMLSYYLPDPSDGTVDTEGYWSNTDTVDNVKKYNSESATNGKTDATALSEALKGGSNGTSSDGRTVDEILDEMGKHQDEPAYGGTFVSTYGIDNFVELPITMSWHYTKYTGQKTVQYGNYSTATEAVASANDKLGHILAAATHTDTPPEGYDSWSDALYQSVSAKGHRGRMSSLNEFLATDGVVYDTDTLVQLGDKLEDLSFKGGAASHTGDQISGYHDDTYGWFYNEGRSFQNGSMGPLYGVTKAMGNNPDAAQQYLTPDGEMKNGKWVPGDQTNSRWQLLTEHKWDSEVGLDGFTAAQAAASSHRSSTDPEVAGAATWLTSRSMEYAVDNVETENYTDIMKENLSVLVANSRKEVASVANGGSPDGGNSTGLELSDGSNTLSSLIYRIIDNKNAATTIGTALAEETVNSSNPTDAKGLKDKYQFSASVYGYLDALGSERAAEIYGASKKHSDESKSLAGTALTAFTTIAGAGLSGPAAPTVWSLGTSVTKPLLLSQLDNAPSYQDPIAASRNALEAQAYAEASNKGLITESGAYDPQRMSDKDGNTYSWFSPENKTMDLAANPSDAQNEQVHNWANSLRTARTNNNEESYPNATGIFNSTDAAIDAGMNSGKARISGEDGQGGDEGDIKIKK